jgi:hypothetical protein
MARKKTQPIEENFEQIKDAMRDVAMEIKEEKKGPLFLNDKELLQISELRFQMIEKEMDIKNKELIKKLKDFSIKYDELRLQNARLMEEIRLINVKKELDLMDLEIDNVKKQKQNIESANAEYLKSIADKYSIKGMWGHNPYTGEINIVESKK